MADVLHGVDRDVGAGKEASLLVWVPVHGELKEIRANAAIVQKGVSLARRYACATQVSE